MKRSIASVAAAFAILSWSAAALAQPPGVSGLPRDVVESPQAAPAAQTADTPPTLVRVSGRLAPVDGILVRTETVKLTISLYEQQDSPTPLWVEEQVVTPDAEGRYAAFAGASVPEGLPRELFTTGAARWIGVRAGGEPEQPRFMLLTVPYALKARDAETLAGRPLDAFVTADKLTDTVKSTLKEEKALVDIPPQNYLSTIGRIPKFSTTDNQTVDSIITESAGKIGIGTTNPSGNLHLYAVDPGTSGNIVRIQGVGDQGEEAGLTYYAPFNVDNSLRAGRIYAAFDSALYSGARLTLQSMNAGDVLVDTISLKNGNVGIGTTGPNNKLSIRGSSAGVVSTSQLQINDGGGVNAKELWIGYDTTNDKSYIQSIHQNSAYTPLLLQSLGGNVGIGTTSPTAKLDVNGSINVTGNINAKYQDVAEWVETPETLEAGTVVIVDPKNANRVVPSPRAYDTRVAGAVSAQPGLILGEAADNKAMVAQSGRVRVKVDASYGAIRIGDLLVTSPTPGYAMRSRPAKIGGHSMHRPGTLLGKALEALPNGKGEVLVLLTLQ
jgi:hypothetical protein